MEPFDFSSFKLFEYRSEPIVRYSLVRAPGIKAQAVIITVLNEEGVTLITGDWGTWVFNIKFNPSQFSVKVDRHYMLSKMPFTTAKGRFSNEAINEELDDFLEEVEHALSDAQWGALTRLRECQQEFEYLAVMMETKLVYGLFDFESVPSGKRLDPWLSTIFDAMDEIIKRQ